MAASCVSGIPQRIDMLINASVRERGKCQRQAVHNKTSFQFNNLFPTGLEGVWSSSAK